MAQIVVRRSEENLSFQAVIAEKCHVAVSFVDRLVGLIGHSQLNFGEAMLFPKCNNIHLWFMRFPIDVVFARRLKQPDGTMRFTICSVREDLKPWRLLPVVDCKATEVLELPQGAVKRYGLKLGDQFEIVWGEKELFI